MTARVLGLLTTVVVLAPSISHAEEFFLQKPVAKPSSILAIVNGTIISAAEVEAAATPALRLCDKSIDEGLRDLLHRGILQHQLKEFIEQELILSEAQQLLSLRPVSLVRWRLRAEQKFSEDVAPKLERDGIDPELVRRSIVRSFMAVEYIRSRTGPVRQSVPKCEVHDYYTQRFESRGMSLLEPYSKEIDDEWKQNVRGDAGDSVCKILLLNWLVGSDDQLLEEHVADNEYKRLIGTLRRQATVQLFNHE